MSSTTETSKSLTADERQLIADAYKLLPAELPGFVGRQQQKDMIQFGARAYASDVPVVIEATTGTGKSLGYQIPGIAIALSRDKRFIISTKTANLQDQIANRDLIVVSNIFRKLGHEITSVVVKGRERYVCPLRLQERAEQASLIDDQDATASFNKVADAWESGKWDGIRDSLPFTVSNPIWIKVNNNRHSCTNDRCPMAKECPHMDMKTKLKTAKVIITNHSYFLSTVAVSMSGGDGPKNPVIDFEKNIFAFDEGHHLHDQCIDAFASKASIDEEMLNDAGRMMAALGANGSVAKSRGEAMRGIGIAIRSNIRTLCSDVGMFRFSLGSIPKVLSELVGDYAESLKAFIDEINDAIEAVEGREETRASALVVLGNAKAVVGQLEERHTALIDFTSDSSAPRARWVDSHKEMCTVYSAPFEAAGLAKAMLWKEMKGAIITSATITSMGNFTATLSKLGLPRDTPTLQLTSPLDYSRARLIVPRLFVDANSKGHGSMVTSFLRRTMFNSDHRGGLMYFTSRKKMEAVYASLTPEEQSLVIVQGDLSASAMKDEHIRRIDAGRKSFLFGMDSISEGVDLPGKYCSLVVADKLPFPSPDDPILASHSEHLEAKGMHPFPMLMLPIAAEKLAQLVGRLIRTETDWGDVFILDRRLVDKKYGAQLLKSTPFNFIHQL